MNTIFNKTSYHKKKFFFLVITLLLSGNSIAQQASGPFFIIPDPPPLQQIWSASSTAITHQIYMNNTTSFNKSIYDGILLKFNIDMNTNSSDVVALASFKDEDLSANLPLISIYYKNPSIFVRRYYEDNLSKYYDYQVYDNLTSAPGDYEIKLYVTANFIFIVITVVNNGDHYLSPVFFGLNDSMTKFLNRSSKAIIGVGSTNNPVNSTVSNVSLHAFSYNRPVGTDSQGKKVYEGLLPNIRAWIKQLYVN
jgi:hypothetical protein